MMNLNVKSKFPEMVSSTSHFTNLQFEHFYSFIAYPNFHRPTGHVTQLVLNWNWLAATGIHCAGRTDYRVYLYSWTISKDDIEQLEEQILQDYLFSFFL